MFVGNVNQHIGVAVSMKRVHVVGTGTIGEPLIGLLAMHKEAFGIDEVTFHKNSARIDDRPKLNQMIAKGARLAVTDGKQRVQRARS